MLPTKRYSPGQQRRDGFCFDHDSSSVPPHRKLHADAAETREQIEVEMAAAISFDVEGLVPKA